MFESGMFGPALRYPPVLVQAEIRHEIDFDCVQSQKIFLRNWRGHSQVQHLPNGLSDHRIISELVHFGPPGLMNMVVPILKQIRLVLMLNLVTRIFVEAEAQIDLQNQKLFEFVFVSCLMSSTLHPIPMAMVQLSTNSIDQTPHQGKFICSENKFIFKQFSVFLQTQQVLHLNSPL